MKKKLNAKPIILLNIIICSNIVGMVLFSTAQEETPEDIIYRYTGELTSQNENTWTNDKWQFYQLTVGLGKIVDISLFYEGDLDLDLRLYWKRDNTDVVGFNGFDLTHCDMADYAHADNSQFRTLNTTKFGRGEELEVVNPSYTRTEDQIAYVLVFVYEGTGSSNYTLQSTEEMTLINDAAVYDCNFVILTLVLYIVVSGGIIGLFYYILRRKKRKLTQPEKKQKQKEKEEQEKKIKHVDLDTVL